MLDGCGPLHVPPRALCTPAPLIKGLAVPAALLELSIPFSQFRFDLLQFSTLFYLVSSTPYLPFCFFSTHRFPLAQPYRFPTSCFQ
jgi:hypothetical protein